MAKVNVVVLAVSPLFAMGIGEQNIKKIASVSPDVVLKDASPAMQGELKGDIPSKAQVDAILSVADVILARRMAPDLLRRAPKLKWMQMTFAGMEKVIDDDLRKSDVILTNASGIQAVAIAEWVMTALLAFDKRLLHFQALKTQKKWEPGEAFLAQSQTIGILGLGHIGTEVAKRAKAFGMRVLAIKRSAKKETRGRYADVILPPGELPRLLKESDFVTICLPSTAETNGLIGEKELRMMKPTARIINIGRGTIIDETALIRALKESWIAGAGLDVYAVEPLPLTSPLWDMPNVIHSPHMAGRSADTTDRVVDLFCDNLKRFMVGKTLMNVVDKNKGY